MDRLDEIRALCDAAKAQKEKGDSITAACIAWSIVINDIPYLLAEVDRLNTVNAKYTSNSAEITINGLQYVPKDTLQELTARAEKAEAERDAAIADWRGFCAKCSKRSKQYLSDGQMDAVCATCRANGKCNWEWRGPQEAGKGETE